MKIKKLLIVSLIFIIAISIFQYFLLAHPGNTDSNGGHYDRTNGEYHYHHGYSAHSHYDMDGDGDIDCPYNFKDKTNHHNTSNNEDNSLYNFMLAMIFATAIVLLVIAVILISKFIRKKLSEKKSSKNSKYSTECPNDVNAKYDFVQSIKTIPLSKQENSSLLTVKNLSEWWADVSNCAKDHYENNSITYSERLLLKDAPESIAQNTDELNVLRNYKINWDLNYIAFLNALEKTDEFSILLENAKEWDKQEQKKKDDKEKALLKKQQRIKKFLILPTIITGAIITFLLLALASELLEDLIMFIYGYYPIMFIIVASGFKNRCKDSIWQATIVCSPAFLSLLISIVIPIIAGALSIAGVVVSLLIFEYKFIYTINPK